MNHLLLLAASLFFYLSAVPAQQPDHLDFRILREIAAHRTPGKNRFFKIVSDWTTPLSMAEPAGLYTAGLIRRDKPLQQQALYGLESIAVSSVVTVSMKQIIGRPRPYVRDPLFIPVTHAGLKSFPSGHTSLAFSSATALTLAIPKWYVAAPAFGWAALVGYSRMYLGVHYPSDVLAGALVGIGSALLIYWVNK